LDPFELLDYNPSNLAYALKNDFNSVDSITTEKFHFRYLLDYLGEVEPDALKAKTIVIEHDYVSRSFLADYSSYYSLCFNDGYKRKCNRIHFFNTSFNSADFIQDILNCSGKIVNDESYLGHIVVKNLPTVIIGATLLKTYSNNSSRFYITRECSVNLFGKKLNFRSLIFQEQDKVVSACATTALWISFYKTSNIFQTYLPSPSEITTSAKNSFNASGRIFPNKEGLDHFQIGNAIENVGLVFELRNKENLKDPSFVKSFLYAYCKLGLPVLLGIDIPEKKGRHLITISGFKNEKLTPLKSEVYNVSLVSDNLNLFYAHDDRIGPFSRLKIAKKFLKAGIVETSWWKDPNGSSRFRANVVSIIVPIYKKIRITFEDILNDIRKVDYHLKMKLPKEYKLIWDIYLSTSNDYKNEIISNNDLTPDFKESVAFTQLPKYIWIARLLTAELVILEFIFDSTDVSLGQFCLMINCYDSGLLSVIKTELQSAGFRNFIKKELNKSYLDILDSLSKNTPTSGHKLVEKTL
jgi:hypothetical protein